MSEIYYIASNAIQTAGFCIRGQLHAPLYAYRFSVPHCVCVRACVSTVHTQFVYLFVFGSHGCHHWHCQGKLIDTCRVSTTHIHICFHPYQPVYPQIHTHAIDLHLHTHSHAYVYLYGLQLCLWLCQRVLFARWRTEQTMVERIRRSSRSRIVEYRLTIIDIYFSFIDCSKKK